MTRDKLEKTYVACYAIFTDWGYPKITKTVKQHHLV